LRSVLDTNDRPLVTAIRGSQFGDQGVLTGCLRMCIESLQQQLFTASATRNVGPAPVGRSRAGYADAAG
jgi:hypothetical protein